MSYNHFKNSIIESFRTLNKYDNTKFDYSDYKNSDKFEVYHFSDDLIYSLVICIDSKNKVLHFYIYNHKEKKKIFSSRPITFGIEIYEQKFSNDMCIMFRAIFDFFLSYQLFYL